MFYDFRQCELVEPHDWHIHLDIIAPGVRGVKYYRCDGVEEDSDSHSS